MTKDWIEGWNAAVAAAAAKAKAEYDELWDPFSEGGGMWQSFGDYLSGAILEMEIISGRVILYKPLIL